MSKFFRTRLPALLSAAAVCSISFPVLPAVAATTSTVVYRVNAGGGVITGSPSWQGDKSPVSPYSNASLAKSTVHSTSSAIDMSAVPTGLSQALFKANRWDPATGAEMKWNFPVAPGWYEVRLYFAEPVYSSAGIRIFNVDVEGKPFLNQFDIVAAAGKRFKAISRNIVLRSDSALNIDFRHVKDNPIISGIEIVQLSSAPVMISPSASGGEGEGEAGAASSTVDIAVMYAPNVPGEISAHGTTLENMINDQVTVMNQALANSAISANVRVVGYRQMPVILSSTIDDYLFAAFSTSAVGNFRNEVGADIVLIILDKGMATTDPNYPRAATIYSLIQGNEPYAEKSYISGFYVDSLRNSNFILAHEIGHLLGAHHELALLNTSELSTKNRRLHADACAFVKTADIPYQGQTYRIAYGTVMFGGSIIIDFGVPYFSTSDASKTYPVIDQNNNVIGRVPLGSAECNNAGAVRALIPQVAAYRTAIKDPGLDIMNLIPASTLSYVMEGVRPMQANSWKVVGSSNGSFYNAEFTLSPSGTITGTAKTPGTVTFTVQATDLNGTVHERVVSFKISPSPLQNQTWKEDVNNNARLTEADAAAIDTFLAANGEKRVTGFSASVVGYLDANGDGWVNSADAVLVRSTLRLDVNHDEVITPLDALININYINAVGATVLSSPTPAQAEELAKNPSYSRDVNSDGQITALDVLMLINYLNARSPQ